MGNDTSKPHDPTGYLTRMPPHVAAIIVEHLPVREHLATVKRMDKSFDGIVSNTVIEQMTSLRATDLTPYKEHFGYRNPKVMFTPTIDPFIVGLCERWMCLFCNHLIHAYVQMPYPYR
jgi:hypothetical protein